MVEPLPECTDQYYAALFTLFVLWWLALRRGWTEMKRFGSTHGLRDYYEDGRSARTTYLRTCRTVSRARYCQA